jgi:alkylation response protein AidB-like acyl-CoA dehydrogenase
MQFSPNEQQRMIRDGVRKFAEGTLKSGATARDAAGTTAPELLKQLAALGVFGLSADEAHGGLGLDLVAAVLAIEELAAADAGLALLVVQQQLVSMAFLARVASTPRHTEWLQGLAQGDPLCAWLHGEDTLHRDADTVATRAEKTATGWRLNGLKPDVFGAALARVAIVTAQTDAGLTAFALQMDTAGVTLSAPTDPLGLRSAGLATLTLENVEIPEHDLLGTLGGAAPHVSHTLVRARLGVAAIAVGLAREALRLGGRYALDRQQFGKPIAQFQAIQWQVANSAVELDLARLLLHRAAWAVDIGKNAESATRMARLTATEMATRVTDRAIQMHGGYGYTREFTVERLFRDAWTLDGLFGSPGLQRVRLARLLAA